MARRITAMNAGQGFTANLVAAIERLARDPAVPSLGHREQMGEELRFLGSVHREHHVDR